jgi:hypothetical protein
MSSAAPSPSLRSLFSELEQLFQTETEARVSTSVQAAERTLAENLNQSARRLRQAGAFGEIAAVVCDASARFAKTCGVFHVSEDAVSGERLRSADSDAAARFAGIQFKAAEAAAFAGAIESRDPLVALCTAGEVTAGVADAFAASAAGKIYLFPLTVDRVTVGVICAAGEVENAALELLAQMASAVLEARQRAPARPEKSAGSRPAEPALQSDGLVRIEPAPVASGPDWDDLTVADRQLHLRAQRFARVQVAEMRLYRSEAVTAGRARQDLYAALKESIDQARESYRRQFIAASPTMVDYLHLELVRTLANDNPAWLGGSYPGRLV